MDEQELFKALERANTNSLVQIKLIQYMETEIEALRQENERFKRVIESQQTQIAGDED